MIDSSKETLIHIAEVARQTPNSHGEPVATLTVYSWITRGCNGVKLEAIKRGGAWFTTQQALDRFSERLTLRALGVEIESGDPTPSDSRRADDAAADELQREGFAVHR